MKSIQDKVFDRIEKKWNIHICRHIPTCDGFNDCWIEDFSYKDFKLIVEDVIEFTTQYTRSGEQ